MDVWDVWEDDFVIDRLVGWLVEKDDILGPPYKQNMISANQKPYFHNSTNDLWYK
jgi:hypothetical protein